MTLAQFKVLEPISYRRALRLWHKQDIYIIHDDNSESRANEEKDSEPNDNYVYAIDRPKPLCLVHGDLSCTVYHEAVMDDGYGHCSLCHAEVLNPLEYNARYEDEGAK